MTFPIANEKLVILHQLHEQLIHLENEIDPSWYNGIFERYRRPVVTADHVPLDWRFDLNPATNPLLLERQGINAVFNPGAIELDGKILLVCRAEGYDRKSFFAIAESETGTDRFRFWDEPIDLGESGSPDVNVYDMRLVQHEDGWIYGLFCTERKDPSVPADLKTRSSQQRNVVLHPKFVGKQYALYTRPQDGFIDTGSGGGIGWALCDSMENATIGEEQVIEPRVYHTIKEVKNGQGPAPLWTEKGWLHLAHGVRNTAAGLRYVLYLFMTDLAEPQRVIHRPGGYFLAPWGEERVGDVSNVTFSNGWVLRGNKVFIYYASSDTRIHVATSSLERLLDYAINTPEDGLTSRASVQARLKLIRHNRIHAKNSR
jgi:4-O-beta-D-mannosyl-D-glucose phosphorylase